MSEQYKSQKMSELVAYQKGSVVSRTLINKTAGTVTFFAFDKDQGLSEHKAPYEALVTILDGEAEVKIAGKLNIVKAGELIVLPADTPHALCAKTRFKMMLTMIKEK